MPEPTAVAKPGAGRLVLVVGPSGAGKDSLIDAAREVFAEQPLTFARRIVTRLPSAAERHDTMDRAAFASARAAGFFAFDWEAHGLCYAIPITIDAALARGDTVVCNVSRGIVPTVRGRYPDVWVIFVDAPLSVRLARIAGRARPSEAPDRGRRPQAFTPAEADRVIHNDGSLATAVAGFCAALREG